MQPLSKWSVSKRQKFLQSAPVLVQPYVALGAQSVLAPQEVRHALPIHAKLPVQSFGDEDWQLPRLSQALFCKSPEEHVEPHAVVLSG